jgi:hypothetical protein
MEITLEDSTELTDKLCINEIDFQERAQDIPGRLVPYLNLRSVPKFLLDSSNHEITPFEAVKWNHNYIVPRCFAFIENSWVAISFEQWKDPLQLQRIFKMDAIPCSYKLESNNRWLPFKNITIGKWKKLRCDILEIK